MVMVMSTSAVASAVFYEGNFGLAELLDQPSPLAPDSLSEAAVAAADMTIALEKDGVASDRWVRANIALLDPRNSHGVARRMDALRRIADGFAGIPNDRYSRVAPAAAFLFYHDVGAVEEDPAVSVVDTKLAHLRQISSVKISSLIAQAQGYNPASHQLILEVRNYARYFDSLHLTALLEKGERDKVMRWIAQTLAKNNPDIVLSEHVPQLIEIAVEKSNPEALDAIFERNPRVLFSHLGQMQEAAKDSLVLERFLERYFPKYIPSLASYPLFR